MGPMLCLALTRFFFLFSFLLAEFASACSVVAVLARLCRCGSLPRRKSFQMLSPFAPRSCGTLTVAHGVRSCDSPAYLRGPRIEGRGLARWAVLWWCGICMGGCRTCFRMLGCRLHRSRKRVSRITLSFG
ncbi:hypothetical protein B0J12DRAFT_645778, partial [Macrophomina phaseolina]